MEIDNIIIIDDIVYFLCSKLNFIAIDKFTKAAVVNMSGLSQQTLVKFDEIKLRKNYVKKRIDDKYFIVIDSLDLIHNIQ